MSKLIDLRQINKGKQILTDLQGLKDSMSALEKGAQTDEKLKALTEKVEGFSKITIKDYVKLEGTISKGTTTITFNSDISSLKEKIDKSLSYTIYADDNRTLIGTSGKALTYSFETEKVSEMPSKLVKDTEKTFKRESIDDDVKIKIFVIGSFTFDELKSKPDFLLDNQEMNTVAFTTAIEELSFKLAQDKELINTIEKLVGEKAIQEQIEEKTKTITEKITEVETSLKEVDTVIKKDIEKLKANIDITETLTLGEDKQVEFTLSQKPNDKKVILFINGVSYNEDENCFKVERENKKITWTATESESGFDLSKDFSYSISYSYTKETE